MEKTKDMYKYGQGLHCMNCCNEAVSNDGWRGWEEDEYGDTWVYCELCDVWTAHPLETVEKYFEKFGRD